MYIIMNVHVHYILNTEKWTEATDSTCTLVNHRLRSRDSILKFVKKLEFCELFKIRKNSFYRITSNCEVFEFAQH